MNLLTITQEEEGYFLSLLARFSATGGTPNGGVCRVAGTEADKLARDLMVQELATLGTSTLVDCIGNMFGRLRLGSSKGSILCGSHLDSQSTGGRFDGSLGVVAALAAARVFRRTAQAVPYVHDLVVCNWTNEEGARFTPSLTGSSVFTGTLPIDTALALKDASGISLSTALQTIGYLGSDYVPRDAIAALELHIEQGPLLEKAGVALGIVTSSWPARKVILRFTGEPSHTGPTPMTLRRDALQAAARFMVLAHDLAAKNTSDPIVSIGRIEVWPNSTNVVPCEARVWLEVRHEDPSICEIVGRNLLAVASKKSVLRGCNLEVEQDVLRSAVGLSQPGMALAEKVCAKLGVRHQSIRTVAGHDAIALAAALPSTLLFVPSAGGISHSPREFTSESHLLAGFRVLVQWLHRRLLGESRSA